MVTMIKNINFLYTHCSHGEKLHFVNKLFRRKSNVKK